jgi:hypothetical protein
MGEWDVYMTNEVAVWLDELQARDRGTAELVDDAIYALSVSGPTLGVRCRDSIAYSKVRNLKELRPGFQRKKRSPHPIRLRPVAVGDPVGCW